MSIKILTDSGSDYEKHEIDEKILTSFLYRLRLKEETIFRA